MRLCKKEGSSPVSLQLLRGGIWVLLVLRAVFNMLVRYASPRGNMCFRCLMFNLSGPCEFLFLLCFIVSWT